MDKLLTIIIPTYNMQDYLHRCLDSLLVRPASLELLEVLVVNDGSKDASSQIAHEYASRYTNTFKVVDKENGHYGSCVNRGLAEATGKYIKVLDADDWFDTVELEKLLEKLYSVDVDLILTSYIPPSARPPVRRSEIRCPKVRSRLRQILLPPPRKRRRLP